MSLLSGFSPNISKSTRRAGYVTWTDLVQISQKAFVGQVTSRGPMNLTRALLKRLTAEV